MHKPESILKNEMHKFLWDSEAQTDHLISARRLDLISINKKNELGVKWICCSGGLQRENKRKWKDRQIPRLCLSDEKAVEKQDDGDTIHSWYTENNSPST